MKYLVTADEEEALRKYLVALIENKTLSSIDISNLCLDAVDLASVDINELLDKIVQSYKYMKSEEANRNNQKRSIWGSFSKLLFQKDSPVLKFLLNIKIDNSIKHK